MRDHFQKMKEILELHLKDNFNKYYFLSEADTRAMAKERQKKDNHNLSKYTFIFHLIKCNAWRMQNHDTLATTILLFF